MLLLTLLALAVPCTLALDGTLVPSGAGSVITAPGIAYAGSAGPRVIASPANSGAFTIPTGVLPQLTLPASSRVPSAATSTATAATSGSSGSISSEAAVAAIVLGIMCALQGVMIIILVVRNRALARRARGTANAPHRPPLAGALAISQPIAFLKPMRVVDIVTTRAAHGPALRRPERAVRKISRKTPPRYAAGYDDIEKGLGPEDDVHLP